MGEPSRAAGGDETVEAEKDYNYTPTTSTPTATASPIEADPDAFNAAGSTLMSTKSATHSIYDYVRELGRTFHSYHPGSYPFPNDESELERMELQYETIKLVFGGRHFFAPIENPKKILDIGTGLGQWAIDVGTMFPDCEVTGTDLSPIQPQWVPENVKFVIDDASEEDWLIKPSSYDFIHSRVMLGSFEDFSDIIRKGFYYLRPGGWMQSTEIMQNVYCDDETMSRDYPFLDWTRTQHQAALNVGRPVRFAHKLKKWYEDQGFTNVHEVVYKLPVNGWPKDPHLKTLGRFHEANLLAGIQAFSLSFFHRGLNWSKNETEVYLVNVRHSISDRSVHAYHKIYAVWGQKPETES